MQRTIDDMQASHDVNVCSGIYIKQTKKIGKIVIMAKIGRTVYFKKVKRKKKLPKTLKLSKFKTCSPRKPKSWHDVSHKINMMHK